MSISDSATSEAAVKIQNTSEKALDFLYWILRLVSLLFIIFTFIGGINPARITGKIHSSVSLFVNGVSFESITWTGLGAQIKNGYIAKSTVVLLMVASNVIMVGLVFAFSGGVMGFGNNKVKKIGSWISLGGAIALFLGLGGIYYCYSLVQNPARESAIEMVPPMLSTAFWLYLIGATILFATSMAVLFLVKKCKEEDGVKSEKLPHKYVLFMYAFPIILLTFFFSYLPLAGWRFAFFDYSLEGAISGTFSLKWFKYIFTNTTRRAMFFSVIRNTLAMSGLGLIAGVFPVIFAMFFSEIKSTPIRRIVQTLTTLPNFISWILIYAIAITLFTDYGLLNTLLTMLTKKQHTRMWLDQSGTIIWFQMLAWGVWKGVGWSAIIYLAAIAGIDQGLYEAASIDGAKRFRKMISITLPALIPTYSVMLLLSIAGMLSNGLEQYLVFYNPSNSEHIKVLDLYIYLVSVGDEGSSDLIPFGTVLSLGKSVISLGLLLFANQSSKLLRGESII